METVQTPRTPRTIPSRSSTTQFHEAAHEAARLIRRVGHRHDGDPVAETEQQVLDQGGRAGCSSPWGQSPWGQCSFRSFRLGSYETNTVPEVNVTGVERFVGGGVGLEGLIRGKEDLTGIGISWGDPTDSALDSQTKLTSSPSDEDLARLDRAADLAGADRRILVAQVSRSAVRDGRGVASLPDLLRMLSRAAG